MTRINTIDPVYLLDEWLLAEYRELKRIPNKMRNGGYRNVRLIPAEYRMGMGHERFFLDKMLFLKKRHDSIRAEMTRRTGKEYDIIVDISDLPGHLCNDWEPEPNDHFVNVSRLYWRYHWRKSNYHYKGIVVDDEFVDALYDKFL